MDTLAVGHLRRPFGYLAWAVLGSAFMAIACPAAEYWVAADGNDGAAGSVEKPLRSIQHGVSVMQPGDTLWVRAGRYRENVSLAADKSGALDKWLTVSAAPGDERKVVVGIETPRVDAYGGSASAFSLREVQYVAPHIITPRLSIREDADANQRALVRRRLRTFLWAGDADGKSPLVELLPALSAATGLQIGISAPVPVDWSCPMITRNMKLSVVLDDLARRLNVRFLLSPHDPLAVGAHTVELDNPFGDEDGVAELTIERPDGRGRIDLFARVQADSCLCARIFDDNSRFLSPAGIDDTGAGEMYHKAATRMDAGGHVRLAVVGRGCALMVGDEWLLLNRLPQGMDNGPFQVRVVDQWIKVREVRYAGL